MLRCSQTSQFKLRRLPILKENAVPLFQMTHPAQHIKEGEGLPDNNNNTNNKYTTLFFMVFVYIKIKTALCKIMIHELCGGLCVSGVVRLVEQVHSFYSFCII